MNGCSNNVNITCDTSDPETRTIETPPRPGGVLSATIVASLSCSKFCISRFSNTMHDEPLLYERKRIINKPIEHESRWEVCKQEGKNNWHEHHDFSLHRVRWWWV